MLKESYCTLRRGNVFIGVAHNQRTGIMELKTYMQFELEAIEFKATLSTAKAMWGASCLSHFEKHGDTGTCVLGAGIYCMAVPKGKRKAQKHTLISADSVAQAQGSTNWESGKSEILAYLRANGISCAYEYGFMD